MFVARKRALSVGGVAQPLARGLVADHQINGMAVTVEGWVCVKIEVSAHDVNVGLLARKKQPARPDVKFLSIGLEHSRSIMFGVDADGVKENVFAHVITKHALHLDETRGFRRARILALAVKQADYNGLAFE